MSCSFVHAVLTGGGKGVLFQKFWLYILCIFCVYFGVIRDVVYFRKEKCWG